jgi:hypothetical protein
MTPRTFLIRSTAARISIHGRKAYRVALSCAPIVIGTLIMAGQAYAQSTPSTNGLGAQFGNMAQEASTASGNGGSMAMYAGALICFLGGAWALWQSRQAQNREGGKVAMGLAGMALAGIFATGGVWINKSANTASNGDATISSTNKAVQFGNQ